MTIDNEIVRKLGQVGSSSLHEAMGRKGALPSAIRPIAGGLQLTGPALTVACHPADNVTLLRALDIAGAGDVLVVSTGHYLEAGYFGEVMATACLARGIAGLVIDGGVRDVGRLREIGFPVFSSNICMRGTVKQTLGPINGPIVIGDQVIDAGDWVRGDDDGVVIVPAGEAAEIAEQAIRREADESEKMKLLREGSSLFSLLHLDQRFPSA